MNFNVLFIKIEHLYYFCLILILFILLFFFIKVNKQYNTDPTFSEKSSEEKYELDLTGDGIKDNLYIINKNNNYSLNINTNSQSLIVAPDKTVSSYGNYSEYWPIKVTFLDINRDSIPEIFLQSCFNDVAGSSIIKYNASSHSFENIFFKNNNILGFLDTSNNKTPKLISANLSAKGMTINSYIFIKNKFQEFTYDQKSDENFFCKTLITKLTYFLTCKNKDSLDSLLKDYTIEDLDSKSMKTLITLKEDETSFTFQDAYFIDVKSNDDGYPIEIEWYLSFSGKDVSNNDKITNYTYKVVAKGNNDTSFKIVSISSINNIN